MLNALRVYIGRLLKVSLIQRQIDTLKTYGAVQCAITLVPPLLDMTLQCTGVERLKKLEAAKQFT
jgi:hypothetical protein